MSNSVSVPNLTDILTAFKLSETEEYVCVFRVFHGLYGLYKVFFSIGLLVARLSSSIKGDSACPKSI